MKNAQEWLNKTYPTKSQRGKIRKIFIDRKERESFPNFRLFPDNSENDHYLAEKLEKELDLSDFVNLEMLFINGQKITELKISNCSKLSYLNCSDNELKSLNLKNLTNLETVICSNNFLTELDLSSQDPEKLSSLHISNNNFSRCDLSVFSRFTKLNSLYLGTDDEKRINRNIYGRFFGSLEDLKNLTVLAELDINATDIDGGFEYLPTRRLYAFYCASKREGAGVEKIKKVLGLSEKLVEEESDEGSEEKINRIKIFQRYFWAAKKFHVLADFLNSTIERVRHKTDLSYLQILFFQQDKLTLWHERGMAQEFLELVETELRLAKWKVSEGFEKISHREVENLCRVRTQFIRARKLMWRRQNIWQVRCQQEQPIQNLVQINPHLLLIRRNN